MARSVVFLLSILTDVPGKVIFNQALTTVASITISWTAPSDDNGAVVMYQITYTYDGMNATVTTTEPMYVLEHLNPATRVELSVSAVSICGAVGEPSSTTQYTNEIRK